MARPGTQRRFFAGAGKKDVSSSPTLQSVSGAGRLDFRWVARQPILNRARPVFWGCELLFRDVIENFFRETDAEQRPTVRSIARCSWVVTYCAMDRGLFVKLRARVAAEGRQYLGAASQTVVEALENVESDDLVIAACERPKIFRLYDRRETLANPG